MDDGPKGSPTGALERTGENAESVLPMGISICYICEQSPIIVAFFSSLSLHLPTSTTTTTNIDSATVR